MVSAPYLSQRAMLIYRSAVSRLPGRCIWNSILWRPNRCIIHYTYTTTLVVITFPVIVSVLLSTHFYNWISRTEIGCHKIFITCVVDRFTDLVEFLFQFAYINFKTRLLGSLAIPSPFDSGKRFQQALRHVTPFNPKGIQKDETRQFAWKAFHNTSKTLWEVERGSGATTTSGFSEHDWEANWGSGG